MGRGRGGGMKFERVNGQAVLKLIQIDLTNAIAIIGERTMSTAYLYDVAGVERENLGLPPKETLNTLLTDIEFEIWRLTKDDDSITEKEKGELMAYEWISKRLMEQQGDGI